MTPRPTTKLSSTSTAAVIVLVVASCVGSLGVARAASSSSSSVSLRAAPPLVGFGDAVTIEGRAPAGTAVKLLSEPCGFVGAVQVAAKSPARDGSFSFRFEPTVNTRFQAQSGTSRSNSVAVRVEPVVTVTKLAAGTFTILVTVGNGHFFTGENVPLQTRASSSQAWRTVATGTLRDASRPDELLALSKATVRAAVPAGAQVRANFPVAAAGSCFVATASPTIAG
jgi:hypothetical protein